MTTSTITNWKYFVGIMGLDRAKAVSKKLTELVRKEIPQEKVFIEYKSVQEFGESGDCEFHLVKTEPNNISFEFVGTMS